MSKKVDVLATLKKTGGYITSSHIVYTSGKHGEAYLNKDAIYPHTFEISAICEAIAQQFKDSDIDVVVSPALGGIILSQWTAFHLSKLTGREILGVYTEKTPDKNQVFTRGYGNLVKGKRILIVEDITTTGGSVKKVMNSLKEVGSTVVAICVLANRDPDGINSQSMGAPFTALSEVRMQAWDESACPLCQKGVPVNTAVGKGKDFLAKKTGK